MKRLISIILSDIFMVSLVLYFGAIFAEQFMPGLISRAFNLTHLLYVCIAFGALSILFPSHGEDTNLKKSPLIYILVALLSGGIGVVIWHIMQASSFAGIFGIAGAFIVFLAFFAMMGRE